MSSQSDSESAPDSTTFWETARVASFPQSFATQTSSLKFASIAANGTLEAASDLRTRAAAGTVGCCTSSSLSNSFSTSFDVDEATPYRLTGSVSADGSMAVGHTTTRVTLKTAGGSVIAEGVVASDANCPDPVFCEPVDPIALSSVGVLQPGSYVLEAVSTGSADPFYGFGNVSNPPPRAATGSRSKHPI